MTYMKTIIYFKITTISLDTYNRPNGEEKSSRAFVIFAILAAVWHRISKFSFHPLIFAVLDE